MAYTDFETDNAHYYFVFARHVIGSTDEDIFDSDRVDKLDGIVLEMAHEPTSAFYEQTPNPLEGRNIYGGDQYAVVFSRVKELREKGIELPIYVGDCDINVLPSMAVMMGNSMLRSQAAKRIARIAPPKYRAAAGLAAQLLTNLPEMIGMGLSFLKGKAPKGLDNIVSASGLVLPHPIGEFRNALIASKLEDYLAPKLMDELGRKPTIAIVYGALHAGIRHNLQSEKRRDTVMGAYRKLNYLWFNKPTLDNLVELRLDGDMEWFAREHKTGVQ